MSLKFLGRKRGMTQVFDVNGNLIPGTLIEAGAMQVAQVKTDEVDGYQAIQCAAFPTKESKLSKPTLGHFAKAKVAPHRKLLESRLADVSQYTVGQSIDLSLFEVGQKVDVTGVSKGKGFQGVIKKYGFSGGPASHGSAFHRHAGSTGMRSTPGRCLPDGPRPSRMGFEQKTIQSLEVLAVDAAKGVIVVKGAIPGPKNGFVTIQKAIK